MRPELIDSANTFGPTLIKGLGFSTQNSSLLNIPFGAVQAISILAGSYAAARFKIKSAMLVVQCCFTLAGGAMMYVAESGENRQQTLALVGYYFLAFSFGCSPIVYSWAIANVGGVSRRLSHVESTLNIQQTKKSTMLSFMNCATATGQLTGVSRFPRKGFQF